MKKTRRGEGGSQKHEKTCVIHHPLTSFTPTPLCPPLKVSQFVKRCVEIWSDIFFSLKNFFVTFFYTERERAFIFYLCVCVTFLCVHKNELFSSFREDKARNKKDEKDNLTIQECLSLLLGSVALHQHVIG